MESMPTEESKSTEDSKLNTATGPSEASSSVSSQQLPSTSSPQQLPSTSTSSTSLSTDRDLPGTFQGRRLFVRNIGYRRNTEMVKFYTKFFQKFGEVDYFDVVQDHLTKKTKGYGFVTFKHLESANAALAAPPEELAVGMEERTVQVFPAQTKTMTMVRQSLAKLKAERERFKKEKKEFVEKLFDGRIESSLPKVDKEKKTATIDKLDDAVLIKIFGYLNVKEKTRCERVCQRWYYAVWHCWENTQSLTFKDSFCLWTQGPALDSITLYQILKKCPQIKLLNLEQTCTSLDEKTCDIIGRCCPQLNKIILRDTEFTKYNMVSIGKFCPKLKSIDFTKCGNMSEKGLWELFHQRPDLEYISLAHVNNITGRCFYKLNSVTHLDLSQCPNIVKEAFSKLAQNCSNTLKTLLAPPLSSEGLAIICNNFPNLETFQVEQSCEMPLVGAKLLAQLTNLKVLRFTPELADLDNIAFFEVTSSCSQLIELLMFGNDRLTDLSSLPDNCENLEILSIDGSKITDDSMKAFARFKNLTSLKVAGSLITDDGANYLLAHSSKLEFLSLNQCHGVSVDTLEYAWELVNQGVASKKLIIHYNCCRVRLNELDTKQACLNFDKPEIWETEEDSYSVVEDDYDDYQDDYILDGDLESEEELT